MVQSTTSFYDGQNLFVVAFCAQWSRADLHFQTLDGAKGPHRKKS